MRLRDPAREPSIRTMQRVGDFWLPDVDVRGGRNLRKSLRLFEAGRGPKIADLEEALAFVERRTVAVDGGANVGAYSRVLMQRFEHVHAFEPAPDVYAALVRNLEEWGGLARVHAYPQALSDRTEAVTLGTRRGRRSPSRGVTGSGTIPAIPLDALDLPDLAFLKLDLEGYEERALRGSERTLRRHRPWVMFEDKPKKSARYGTPGGAHRFLESLGARAVACVGSKRIDWLYSWPP
jgi:FkbM family methyltransferase